MPTISPAMTTLEQPFNPTLLAPATPTRQGPRAWDVVLVGGFTLALLDISNAIGFWYATRGVSPWVIFQSIASGLLGKEAFTGGATSALLGASLHLLMACFMAWVFFRGCKRWPLLYRRPWLCGPAYGLLIYGVMHHVVVPLSRAGTGPFNLVWFLFDFVGHLVLVGLPLALITRWSARR